MGRWGAARAGDRPVARPAAGRGAVLFGGEAGIGAAAHLAVLRAQCAGADAYVVTYPSGRWIAPQLAGDPRRVRIVSPLVADAATSVIHAAAFARLANETGGAAADAEPVCVKRSDGGHGPPQ
eukprot:gene1955-22997_t